MPATKKPHQHNEHGVLRDDPYYWLRERENPEVIAYLEEENARTEEGNKAFKEMEDSIFEEMKNRIKPDQDTVPYRLQDYWYYTRYEEGKEYSLSCRKSAPDAADEQIMLDLNELAKGHAYFSLSRSTISHQQNIIAYAVDTVGRRIYDIRFRDLDTGQDLPDVIPAVTGSMTWAADNKTLFYARQHPETLRSYRIFRHELGTDPADDVLVYEETDETFYTYVYKTKSMKYVAIGCSQTVSNEALLIPADQPQQEPKVFLPRERNHEYTIDHVDDRFYIRTNKEAINFRLMSCSDQNWDQGSWREEIPHREDVFVEGLELFQDYIVLEERAKALNQFHIIPRDGSAPHYLAFEEDCYDAYMGVNFEAETPLFRFGYNSMTTPASVYNYNMATRQKTLLKEDEVLGGFDRTHYHTERRWAEARDGVQVPISLVYRKDMKRPEGNPTLLYGYGSYGYSLDAAFSSPRISLLDRGFVFAVAHIRGGQEMGRQWYENGKKLHKRNTFTDFIDSGEHLISAGVTPKDQLYAMGGSAGGLLMGAVLNMRPDLWAGVVAAVPFVDVVTTMMDESIPLTTGEYDEWGNPNEKEYFDYMLSYSPYDNVQKTDYPPILITTGLHDSQVQYWEPAKWCARLREMKTDSNLLYLKTDMETGHSGATGRYKHLKDSALNYAFVIHISKQ